jgi:hypothetical protein
LKPPVPRRSAKLLPVKPPLVFISYSHHDDDARKTLDKHLIQLKREGVEVWFDGDILPGAEIDPDVRRMLKRAHVFVALGSPDYLNSTYCFDTEYGYAIRKAARKQVHVVVALLRACQWRHTRMARYKLLPKDGKPVDQWARRGDAYEDIVEGIRAVVKVVRRDREALATTAAATGKPKRSSSKTVAKTPAAGGSAAAAKKSVAARPKVSKDSSVASSKTPRKRSATDAAAKGRPAGTGRAKRP